MSKRIRVHAVVAGLCALALGGCGGGGGGSSTPTTVMPPAGTTFPLGTAVAQLFTTGYQKTAVVSGTASSGGASYPVGGSVTLTDGAVGAATTFAGQTALTSTTTVTGSVTVNGQTLNLATSEQDYVTTSYAPLGYTSSTAYCVAPSPGVYPAQVSVGQTGTIGTYKCYTDSTMAVPTGTETLSYVVKAANSTTTAEVSIIDSFVNTANQQTSSGSSNYLIDTAGAVSLLSVAVLEQVSGITLNLTFTAQ